MIWPVQGVSTLVRRVRFRSEKAGSTYLPALALTAAVATFLLIAIGGIVRATGSGLGCPDWPGCSTELDVHALIESSHRAAAGVVALLIFGVAAVAVARRRDDAATAILAVVAAVLVVGQALLGAAVVLLELPFRLVTLHLGVAFVIAALTVVIADRALRGAYTMADEGLELTKLAILTAGLVLLQVLLGSWVAGRGAGLAFRDFPLMDGSLLPTVASEAQVLHWLHRLLAIVVSIFVGLTVLVAYRATRDRVVRWSAVAAGALVTAQVALGGANVLSELAPVFVVLHLVGASLLWGALVLLAASALRLSAETAGSPRTSAGNPSATTGVTAVGGSERAHRAADTFRAYVALTKPRIIELLLVTTVPTMLLAANGLPSLWLVAATLVGGTLAAGSANAINCYIDRGIDEVMRRTRGRPLPQGEIAPAAALRFGIGLAVVSFVWLWATVNLLSALLGLAAIGFYVVVYTAWLKRRTPHNIVIGGAAGCAPVLVGWAAVTGGIELPALVLFAIVFYWTPPHFWALALRYRGDYQAARVPMLPVVAGGVETSRQILLYSVLLVAVSLLLLPVAKMGWIYLATAVVLGAVFLGYAVAVRRDAGDGRSAIRLFRYSTTYLTLLFLAIAVDSLVRLPLG